MQNVDWSSQADLTLDSQPKCFVGWLKNDLPACDAVEKIGDWCNCTAYWDKTITTLEWHNTTYNMLAWNPNEFMINVSPTTPLVVQVFFNCELPNFHITWPSEQRVNEADKSDPDNSEKAYNDSFSKLSPSVWLAIWDANLSLEESLEYGHTRLQLIDALAMSSISLGLNYKETPTKKPAYDYELSTITTIPQTGMTCDLSSDAYYGACHITVLVQYPNFGRDVTTIEQSMQWMVSSYFCSADRCLTDADQPGRCRSGGVLGLSVPDHKLDCLVVGDGAMML